MFSGIVVNTLMNNIVWPLGVYDRERNFHSVAYIDRRVDNINDTFMMDLRVV